MTNGEKLERAINFTQQLADSMKPKLDSFETRISKAVIDELIDVLKEIKTEELKARKYNK